MAKRIILLEDEPLLVELLQELLRLEGFDIRLAASGAELQEQLRAKRAHAVLIDVNLKEANGLDLLDEVRAQPEFDDVTIILSSGMDFERESIKRGADAFLMKPYMPEDLVQLLQKSKQ